MSKPSMKIAMDLGKELKKLFPDKEFVVGILSFAETDDNMRELLGFIRRGENVTVETVSILALNLHEKNKHK